MLRGLADFIAFESRCCGFLTFHLVVESDSDIAMLRVTGPADVQEMLDRWRSPDLQGPHEGD